MIALKEIREEIIRRDNFLLMGHVDPDGDSIGSLFAMKWYLDKLGKSALVLLDSPLDSRYQLLDIKGDEYQTFQDYTGLNQREVNVLALDVGNLERLGDGQKIVSKSYLLNIDHHIDNPAYGDINYINAEKAAVGEIIYDIIKLDPEPILDKKIATAISIAIIADTGGFRYQNTSSQIFKIISELMRLGVDMYNINRAIFANKEYSSVKLKGRALSTLELNKNKKIAYITVEQSMLNEVGAEEKDTSDLVNYARDIVGVEVGLVLIEIEKNQTRVSFRSNNYCPVNEIAGIFGGGGHPRAAGCTVEMGINKTQKLILDKVEDYV